MKRFLLAVAALTFVVAPTATSAQIDAPNERVRLTGVSGVVANWDNVYIGPYQGQLISDPTRPSLTLYCVDFVNGASVGNTWDANVTGLTGGDLSVTRLGLTGQDPTSSLLRYRKAAFLSSLFSANAVTNRRYNWSGIHAAIWTVMTPGFPNISGVNNPARAADLAAPWLAMADDAAANGFQGMNWAEWQVLTDENSTGASGGRQEYLARATVTPEPETWALMFTGLLIVGFVGRRRLRELGEEA